MCLLTLFVCLGTMWTQPMCVAKLHKRIVVEPRNSSNIYLAVSGSVYSSPSDGSA